MPKGLNEGLRASILEFVESQGREVLMAEIVAALPGFHKRRVERETIGACYGHGLKRRGGRGRPSWFSRHQGVQAQTRLAGLHAFRPLNPRRDIFENWRLCERDPLEVSQAAVHSFRR